MSEPSKTIELTGAIDTRKESLLEFPCDFPIKIMGRAHPEFKDTIFKVVSVHDNEIDLEKIEERASPLRSLTLRAPSPAESWERPGEEPKGSVKHA